MRTTRAMSSKIVVINAIAIVLAAAFAIVFHAVLPAPVEGLDFDSALVRLVGFPVVAVSYFVLLFAHCAIVVQCFGRRSDLPRLEIGWRFGLAFALLYLIGMQEVVVDASPFEAWGREFVVYQFFMGVGDAVPVFALCTVLAYLTLAPGRRPTTGPPASAREAIAIVAVIALAFFVQRTIGHTTGLVHSNVESYPVQTHLWTPLFGAALGCVIVVLVPVFSRRHGPIALSVRLVLLTIGVNWMLFNGFIGMIFSGLMPQMLLRSGLDTAVVFVASVVVLGYVRRSRTDARVAGSMPTNFNVSAAGRPAAGRRRSRLPAAPGQRHGGSARCTRTGARSRCAAGTDRHRTAADDAVLLRRPHGLEDPIEDAGLGPAAHARADRVPTTATSWQPAPGAAVHGDVRDRVQQREVVDAHVAGLDGQDMLDQGELLAGELHTTPRHA